MPFYAMKKIIGDLGFAYEKIGACPNDCTLYFRESGYLIECTRCKTSR